MSDAIYVRVPIEKAPLSLAYEAVEDPTFWDLTMPPILDHFDLSPSDYYELTVYQHRLLYDYLVEKGLANAVSP